MPRVLAITSAHVKPFGQVDAIVDQCRRERPDLDPSPIALFGRGPPRAPALIDRTIEAHLEAESAPAVRALRAGATQLAKLLAKLERSIVEAPES